MNPKYFKNGPWIHHATIKRGVKEYVVFRHQPSQKIYIEEVEGHRATFELKQIDDDEEWTDLYHFCTAAGLMEASSSKNEVKIATNDI